MEWAEAVDSFQGISRPGAPLVLSESTPTAVFPLVKNDWLCASEIVGRKAFLFEKEGAGWKGIPVDEITFPGGARKWF